MKKTILLLGYSELESPLVSELAKKGFDVSQTSETVENLSEYDHVISYGYKKILPKKIIESSLKPIINLHISYLPFNRGMHPNFWSFFDDTPSGVSIHQIDEGIDTGPVLMQKEMHFEPHKQTFSQTYVQLRQAIENLFLTNLSKILTPDVQPTPQNARGTFHSKDDLPVEFQGWHCNINNEIERLRRLKRNKLQD